MQSIAPEIDFNKLANLLAQSFAKDANFISICGNEKAYHKYCQKLFYFIGKSGVLQAQNGYIKVSDVSSIISFSSENCSAILATYIKSGVIHLIINQPISITRRLLKFGNILDKERFKAIQKPHQYLYSLAVSPTEQNKGIGKKALAEYCDWLDSTKQSCYLETSKDKNANLYKKFGFETVSEFDTFGNRNFGMIRAT